MKPEFICLGAQKAGTSWLYSRLREHPEISLPPVKEMHYFDRSESYPSPNTLADTKVISRLKKHGYIKDAVKEIARSIKSRNLGLADWWRHYYFRDFSDAWYLKAYEMQSGITGDITPSYSILNEEDVARMQRIIPHARLVFLIRNPIDRAWSHYRFNETFGNSIELDNLSAFKKFVDSPDQELRSDYLRTINLYLKFFDPSQLLLGFYDAITNQPESLLSGILKHIGATETTKYKNLHHINNKSRDVNMPVAYRRYLETKYCNDLEELAKRYGGYASEWLNFDKNKQADVDEPSMLPPVTHA